MVRYIAIAALVACLSLSLALWWQMGRMDTLRDANARLTRNAAVLQGQIEQARLAAAVADAYAARERRMNAETSNTIEKIRTLELGDCADAPLDPALIDLLGIGLRAED